MIVTSPLAEPETVHTDGNKTLYICFILAVVMLAASPIYASEPSAPMGKVSTVRVDRRTGKLVRMVPAPKPDSAEISKIVQKAAADNHVDPLLVESIIKVESNFDSTAVSRVGAEGLMQLMPPTAKMLGVSDSFDAKQNIEAGVKYLKQLQDQYKDSRLALAAYNAGPGAVQKYGTVPPYPETQKYVQKVGTRYLEARKNAPASASPAATPQAPPPVPVKQPEKRVVLESFVDQDGRLHLTTSEQ